ncbi:hypothetical protein MIND_00962600 [Mycena indigotica]|uniref:F-box domain-containing protein n=1 Tax=Mycena indigotica TaxID=2126181 RepID=A0A8H6W2U0_9AGAR|nr:uncharacterized protein MIND_00962600 [Mycena indigotica]KAF7297294.1 hypothetical protein MIND_00962600 [Mycena indigotica]
MDTPVSRNRPPTKRRRTSTEKNDVTNFKPVFVNLPFELVAMILVFTQSTKDVLAVARTCKFLCNTLLRPENVSVWRKARETSHPAPLPDPMRAGLSEPAFAAMLFDMGPCANCARVTHNMFSSFSLRIRFCSRPECLQKWSSSNVSLVENVATLNQHQRHALEWLPLAESTACFHFPSRIWGLNTQVQAQQPWPAGNKVYLTAHMTATLSEFAHYTADKVRQRHALEKGRHEGRMKFFVEVYLWKGQRMKLAKEVQKANEALGQTLATENGYDYNNLIHGSITYNSFRLHKTNTLQRIVRQDFTNMADIVEAELLAYNDRQERRAKEAAIISQRAQVEQRYSKLLTESRSQVPPTPIPALPEFRTMPILQLLHSDTSSAAARKTRPSRKTLIASRKLKDTESIVSKMLDSELDRWRAAAEQDLGATLGFPVEWKTAKSNTLHPVQRLTARWSCTRCGKVARPYTWDECMDFIGVCRHECRGSREPKRQPRKESLWKASNFVKDDQAINAITKVLKLCDIDPANKDSLGKWDAIGARIACLSCPTAIVMRPSNLVGHSHRHQVMDLEVLEAKTADAILVKPLEQGLARYLLGGTDDNKVKKAKATWIFGCRHCEQERRPVSSAGLQSSTVESEEDAEVNEVEEIVRGPRFTKKHPKRLGLNALWCHLKEKHKVQFPSDEDMYHVVD